MPYKSPIEVASDISQKMEDNCIKAVLSVGIKVDKEELIKALRYDRGQYEAGFIDGARSTNIVRCKDCKWYKNGVINIGEKFCFRNQVAGCRLPTDPEFFCSNGERSESE